MMPPLKQEPIENSPEMKPPDIELLPDIKSETIEYSPNVSPSKRLKTLSSNSPSTSAKGKSKILKEDDDDSFSQQQLETCGVCLLDEGMSLRGFIDSCDHYFCFVCIMEWAKVESRCPICKRRFATIRRPPKHGVFLSERIVDVPVRDQIYNYSGNATIGPPDPYSQVKCSVCSGSSDDSFLLLCDLCDSAAHSYCVGLGRTVPEGDWFCKDCTLSRDEHAKVDMDTTTDDGDDKNNPPSRSNTEQIACPEVSIHDIVRDSSSGERLKTQSNAPNARTLQRCLDVHSRIRVLRENWDGFRGGSLNFSSSSQDRFKTSQSQSISLNRESTSQNRSYDINRAWKMMDVAAKALGKKAGNKNSVPKDSEFHKKKERLLNETSMVRPNNSYFWGLKKSQSEVTSSRKIIASAEVKNDRYNCRNSAASNVVGSSGQLSSLASRNLSAASNVVGSSGQSSSLPSRNLSAASNVVGSSGQSSSLATDKRCAKKVTDAIIEKKENKKNGTQLDGNVKDVENAKSEIQSLVKLNLKLLSRDKKLEVDVFKEVARHATHSIMAACGIEPPKSRFRSFERLVCVHSQTQKRPTSTLMPTSCRECFFIFVKDVVTTIASDTTASCKQ